MNLNVHFSKVAGHRVIHKNILIFYIYNKQLEKEIFQIPLKLMKSLGIKPMKDV